MRLLISQAGPLSTQLTRLLREQLAVQPPLKTAPRHRLPPPQAASPDRNRLPGLLAYHPPRLHQPRRLLVDWVLRVPQTDAPRPLLQLSHASRHPSRVRLMHPQRGVLLLRVFEDSRLEPLLPHSPHKSARVLGLATTALSPSTRDSSPG